MPAVPANTPTSPRQPSLKLASPGAPVQLPFDAVQVPVPPSTVPLPRVSDPSQNCSSWSPLRISRLTWLATAVLMKASVGNVANDPLTTPETLNSR